MNFLPRPVLYMWLLAVNTQRDKVDLSEHSLCVIVVMVFVLRLELMPYKAVIDVPLSLHVSFTSDWWLLQRQ